MTATLEPPIKVFLSYAHADDLVLEFIEPFKTSLKHMAFADQGRQLDIFVDRESIGWGENWQTSIRNAIDGATIFMPVVTRQYFERPACVEELLTFFTEAQNLGVTSLLLPVVVLGHSHITEDSPNAAARVIHERQYRDLREAMIEGHQSATWRRAMVKLAGELVEAASNAERVLGAESSPGSVVAPTRRPTADTLSNVQLGDDDAPGIMEVNEAAERFEEGVQVLLATLSQNMHDFTDTLSGAERMNAMTKPEARTYILSVATKLRPIGEEFSNTASSFEALVLHTDQIMRGYLKFLRDNDMIDQLRSEVESLRAGEAHMGAFEQTERIVVKFLENIRPLEMGSAPLRKSIRSFRDGARAINSGISMIRAWPTIADE